MRSPYFYVFSLMMTILFITGPAYGILPFPKPCVLIPNRKACRSFILNQKSEPVLGLKATFHSAVFRADRPYNEMQGNVMSLIRSWDLVRHSQGREPSYVAGLVTNLNKILPKLVEVAQTKGADDPRFYQLVDDTYREVIVPMSMEYVSIEAERNYNLFRKPTKSLLSIKELDKTLRSFLSFRAGLVEVGRIKGPKDQCEVLLEAGQLSVVPLKNRGLL